MGGPVKGFKTCPFPTFCLAEGCRNKSRVKCPMDDISLFSHGRNLLPIEITVDKKQNPSTHKVHPRGL